MQTKSSSSTIERISCSTTFLLRLQFIAANIIPTNSQVTQSVPPRGNQSPSTTAGKDEEKARPISGGSRSTNGASLFLEGRANNNGGLARGLSLSLSTSTSSLYLLLRSRSGAQLRREKIILINGEPITGGRRLPRPGRQDRGRHLSRQRRHRVSACLPACLPAHPSDPPSARPSVRPTSSRIDRTSASDTGIARVTRARRGSCEIWAGFGLGSRCGGDDEAVEYDARKKKDTSVKNCTGGRRGPLSRASDCSMRDFAERARSLNTKRKGLIGHGCCRPLLREREKERG